MLGTRNFKSTEEKDSGVKWEKADGITSEKLKAAIKSRQVDILRPHRGGPGASASFLVFPVVLLLFYYFAIAKSQPFYVHIFVVSSVCIFFFAYLIRYIRHSPRPYYNLEKHDIWIKRAKCTDVFELGIGSDQTYFAAFNIGKVHICLQLYLFQYKANPVGEEYIFFKFSERWGNTWEAIAAKEFDRL